MNDPSLFDPVLPELPYAGTSGHSGSSTSESRARSEDADGITTARQTETIRALREAASRGLTWVELADPLGWHHGQASGALSVLHKTGWIARLTETRQRSKVYVLPEYVAGRPTEKFVPNARKVTVPEGMVAVLIPHRIAESVATRESTSILGHACRTALAAE